MAGTARKSTARATKKTQPVATAANAGDGVEVEGAVTRVKLTLVADGETKSYAKFTPPAGSGCVGTFYAPLGTQSVKVLIEGPSDTE